MAFVEHRSFRHLAPMDLSFWLILSTVLGFISTTKHNCTIEELELCFQVLNAITQSEELALAATKEELSIVCRRLQNGFRCIEDHSLRCFTAVQRRIFQSVVSESRHVIEDLCVPGELQEDYLLYAPCWKNVSTDERKCALQYKRLAHSTNPEKDVHDNLKMHCCLFTEFVQCQHEHLLRDCGSEAEQFYQTHMDRMSGSLINEHCILFTHDSTACAFNASSTHNFESHRFLCMLTLYMISSHFMIFFKDYNKCF